MAQSEAGVDWRRTATAPGPLLRLYYTLAFYFCLGVFGVSCLIWSLPAAIAYPLLPRRIGQPIGQFGIMAGFRWFLWVMRATGVLRADLSVLDGSVQGTSSISARREHRRRWSSWSGREGRPTTDRAGA